MSVITFSGRQFSQHAGKARKAALRGPVVITTRGRPTHVLLSMEQYQNLAGGGISLLQAVTQRGAPDFVFKPPRLGSDLAAAKVGLLNPWD
jgi:prevent-host-death family protein